MKSLKTKIFGILAMMSLFAFATNAQTTIFNTPSTDVIAQDSGYVEFDFVGHLTKLKDGGFQSYGVRGVYGVKRNVEIGANVFFTRNSSGTPMEIQPNIKWKAYNNEKRGIAVSGGALFFVPLNKKAGSRVLGMTYINGSKTIKQLKGMRVTAGGYTFLGATKETGTKGGAILGVEQPLFKKVNFVADWFSGKNRLGYASAGFSVFLTKKQTLYAGYSFGNSGKGNNALAVYYGVTF